MVADGPSTRRCGNQMVTNPSCEHLQKVLADSLKRPFAKHEVNGLRKISKQAGCQKYGRKRVHNSGLRPQKRPRTTKTTWRGASSARRGVAGAGTPYFPRSSPMKKRATVPGPVCEPMTVPMSLICTLPASAGNLASTMSRTASASSRHALIESEHLPA